MGGIVVGHLLVHLATGPENPTRAALAFLVARSALEAGHEVDVFVAGDGVSNLRPETLDAGHGIGTGSLREHVDALIAGGVTIHASGMSSKARGLGPDSLGGLAVTMAPPTRLVELAFAADRVLVY
jgi:predicted peroxiredoxin